jgi:hypothetical protein
LERPNGWRLQRGPGRRVKEVRDRLKERVAEFEVEEFVEWFWEKIARFPGENPTVLHKGELQEGLENWIKERKEVKESESKGDRR